MLEPPYRYNGYEVVTDHNMTENGEPFQERRTWKERLFTRPWKPFKGTKTVVLMVPMRKCIRLGNKLVMHPEVLKELKKALYESKVSL